ncbi:arsenical pump-driving ATPase [Alsobacter sp. SYSU M60028]|uniref:Arsenical pump-driving ATPase n=1 Tax=Alsobacter ponti TaxID=2962936 RepID=A0ABT1L6U4_9HYPH|nr:arsenical pump-driving ATPase [Alsobacter ponti]MCP8937142.1 arsenical pump-driving ATPase [Alsobacter ponti]
MPTFRPLDAPTRFLFFTGKGGVGKTSLACATAISLADRGRRVLLVSTDPASNLDEMLGATLGDSPSAVAGVAGLSAMNIDPEQAAEHYRARVLAQLGPDADATEQATVREQLSGACTTEIAAFDEFVGLLAGDAAGFDHVVFDTAPTGHTLRLLSLPKAWTGFLEGNDRGASCLGPHSGLEMREERFRQGLEALSDPRRTTIVLVTRADRGAIREAARTSAELDELGLSNQMLAVNGRFRPASAADPVAVAIADEQASALAAMPEALARLPRDEIPLAPFDLVGLGPLRALLDPAGSAPAPGDDAGPSPVLPGLDRLVDELAATGKGLIMVMGKGGVGKTTIAAAIAVGLARRGHGVHLSTTDPAAHVSFVVDGALDGLKVDRIDPEAETRRYIERVMASKGRDLDEEGRRLLREDLASPCTEEVAVFHAFSRVVAEARGAFVVLDTAPTGHTLLLMDATGAYHRQMMRDFQPTASGKMVTPLMRLQDPDYTRVVLVTLPERTPVSEAADLQKDLRRASIEPYAWVINRSLVASGTRDPLLKARLAHEVAQIERVRDGLAARLFALAWQAEAPVGLARLEGLTRSGD